MGATVGKWVRDKLIVDVAALSGRAIWSVTGYTDASLGFWMGMEYQNYSGSVFGHFAHQQAVVGKPQIEDPSFSDAYFDRLCLFLRDHPNSQGSGIRFLKFGHRWLSI